MPGGSQLPRIVMLHCANFDYFLTKHTGNFERYLSFSIACGAAT
jgi:hypothetical protein